ncbi:unnamed protein product [Wickerhamomyces anomalus]
MSFNSLEKLEAEIVNRSDSDSRNGVLTNNQEEDDWSDIDEKKVLRKIDRNLLPLISVLYLLAYLDRGNIGNAKIEGLVEDLGLSTNEYNLCLTIFFLTYSFFEVPSNMILKKIGAQSVYIPSIMLGWGIVMVCMGVVKDFKGLFVTRLFLGVFGKQALFYSAASIAGAFSGLLAFAIAKMDGVGGYRGWRWIFILEGLLTVVVAVAAYFLMPDYPDTAKFLTPREREFVQWRLDHDNNFKKNQVSLENTEKVQRAEPNFEGFNDSNDVSLKTALFLVFKDWQILLHVLLYWGISVPTYGNVIKGLGYTSSIAQLLTIPIYVTASICSLIQAYFSDKAGIRSIFIGTNLFFVMIGFAMAIAGTDRDVPGVIYAGCFIATIPLYMAFPGIIAWNSNNLSNAKKRAVGMALHIGLGNLGGAFASNFYKPDNYIMGHGLVMGFATMGLLSCGLLVVGYKASNKKREERLIEGKYDKVSDEEIFKMGDKSPYFRYRI